MTYDETTDFLFSRLAMYQAVGSTAYKPGLAAVTELDRAFGTPSQRLRVIHVGGTNGKGSTSHSLAAILTAAGLKTGLFTSPHLLDFRERIRIDGDKIPEEKVTEFVERYMSMELDIRPSFFELTTVMAFEWFVEAGVDVAVIEVGLGGRLDSTNILTNPLATIVTNISLDHTALLGDTPEAIAEEKAGIFKPGIPAIVGEADGKVREVFEHKAAEVGTRVVFASDNIPYNGCKENDEEGYIDYFDTPFGDVRADLVGDCQPLNMATILTSAYILSQTSLPEITPAAVRKGLASVCQSTGLMGRWMTIGKNPRIICDTGHNIGGWKYIISRLSSITSHKEIILGFVKDKDIDEILLRASDIPDVTWHFSQASLPRALPADELALKAAEHHINGDICHDVPSAVSTAIANASPDDVIFVGGSTFIVADFLLWYQTNHPGSLIVDKS